MLFFLIFISSQIFSSTDDVQLYSTLQYNNYNLPKIYLSEEESIWLRGRVVRVGFVKRDFPPYDIFNYGTSSYYEGITADYLKLVELLLGIKIKLIGFNSKKDAIDAIKNEEIDLLTSSGDYESLLGLVLTVPYNIDIPFIFINRHNSGGEINKIGIFYEYILDEVIFNRYPGVQLIHYDTPQKLVSSLIYGDIDAMVIDLHSANYMINSEFVDKISIKDFLGFDSKGFAFALNENNKILLDILNRILLSTDTNLNTLLKMNWSGGGTSVPSKEILEDARYMASKYVDDNQEIKVALSKYSAPVSYIGNDGQPQGILIELLELMKIYTGVSFRYIFKDSIEEQIRALENGEADISALTPSEARDLYFTKSFLSSPYVIVAKSNTKSNYVSTVYMPRGHLLIDEIKLINHHVNVVTAKSYIDALNYVVNSDGDTVTVVPLMLANYYIDHFFQDGLYIQRIITDIPAASLSIAMLNNNYEMINLFSEFINYIPANDVKVITNRWQKNASPIKQNWKDYQYTLYALFFSGSIIALILIFSGVIIFSNYRKKINVKRKLIEQLEFIQIVVDSIPHPIYARNKSLEYVLHNKSFLDFVGCSDKTLLGKYKPISFVSDSLREDIILDHQKALNDNITIIKDRELIKYGEKFQLYHWIHPFSLEKDNSVSGIVCGWIDVSERVSLLEQLSLAKEKADSANVAKSRFIATMSHEIRTPINAILGLLELVIKKYKTNDFDIQSIDIAHQAANDLLDLIGDILDISKIESGKLTLIPKKNNFKNTIYSVYKIYFYLAIQKGIKFNLDFDEKIREDLIYDGARMKQVLVNIVANAIKFTEKGSVNLSVYLIEKSNDTYKIKITLTDQGIGIPDHDMAGIFQAFNQANNHDGKGGTGLGLMISKAICDLMSASFDIESRENIGTKISIVLNFNIYKQDNAVSLEKNSIEVENKRYKILIVDDYAPNRLLISEQLKYLNHSVVQSINGKEALDIYMLDKFDLIITDCNMPEMDGYELARKIRCYEKEHDIESIYIIGYTANAQREIIDDCLAAGMNGCLFKPITIDDLNNAINEALTNKKIVEYDLKKNEERFFDIDMVNALTSGNLELNKKILEQILIVNIEDIKDLESAFNEQNFIRCKSIAHKMKSGANIIGCKQMLEKCSNIEDSLSLEKAESHVKDLMSLTSIINGQIKNEIQTY
ncbi:response regulator [Vibrio metschnikovii]|uniref:response regulator n=1 Tax=Vibrio metschnikovii TaxID=28172 RepID=UPI001C2FC7D6|nr:transporter substrate-binding domain-containing protein [Vibrio metschnikovii]